jgi:hypothetical protein
MLLTMPPVYITLIGISSLSVSFPAAKVTVTATTTVTARRSGRKLGLSRSESVT